MIEMLEGHYSLGSDFFIMHGFGVCFLTCILYPVSSILLYEI